MARSAGVLIDNDLNSVQFNSQVANNIQEESSSINSKKDTSDFNMPTDGNEQGRFTRMSIEVNLDYLFSR